MRTFMAIELSAPVRQPLINLLRGLPRSDGVRWVTTNQLHLTLKFLGEVTDARISQVCDAAAQASAAVAPFPLRISGLGVFPAPRNPRVLWCGVEDPTQSCRRWVELADPLFADLGFAPETRAFTPHITLGRSKSTAGAHVLRETLETAKPPESPEMEVDRIVVFESRLLPTGAQYKALATLPLGGS